jgi:hypothetical protein
VVFLVGCAGVVGSALLGCALDVDWDALRRGRPEPTDASLLSDRPMGMGGNPEGKLDAGGLALPDTSGAREAGASPDAAPGEAGAQAGCALDLAVACNDPSQVGISCIGGAVPSQIDPTLVCGNSMPVGNGESGYCCSGNFCAYKGDFGYDTPACISCYLAHCAAVMCQCYDDSDVDDAGDPYCSDYTQCVGNCTSPISTVAYCESQCDSSFTPTEIEEGATIVSCLVEYCASASQCDWVGP